MRNTIFLLGGLLWTAGLQAEPPSAPPQSSSAPVLGQVLLLDSWQILEGEIRREGDRYRIRRTVGETIIPGEKVLAVTADRPSLYLFLRKQINALDIDERVKLCRWCLSYGLRSEALLEARAAQELRPGREDLERLVRDLEQSPRSTVAAPATTVSPPSDPGVLNPNFNAEAFSLFTTKVQPLLMNACAGCHAGGKGGGYPMLRIGELGNRHATQYNLTTTLKFIDAERPQASKLLIMAVTPHGGSNKPPIAMKSMPTYRLLEHFARYALTPDGVPLPPAPVSSRSAPEVLSPLGESPQTPPMPPQVPGGAVGVPVSQPSVPPKRPEEPQTPKDPFDPAYFNNSTPTKPGG